MNAPATSPVDRRAERTHLFLVATLYFGSASSPVRVRNLSSSGALVESASLPRVGTAVILRRGALEVPGTAAWSRGGKAGIQFHGSIEVADWLPVKDAKPQTQVDQITFGLKRAVRAVADVAPALAEGAAPMAELVGELTALKAQLGALGDQLASDADLLARHPEVQLLDTAEQRIGRIIAALQRAASL